MAKCPNCGKEVSEGVRFCPECGQRIKEGFTPEERQKYIDELKASIGEQKPAEKTGITKKKLAGIIIGCIIAVFVAIIIATPSGTAPTPTPPSTEQPLPAAPSEEKAPPPSKPATFAAVTLTGTGDKTSRPFTVTTQEWTIAWSYTPEDPEYAGFGFFVYPRGETRIYVVSVDTESTTGSTYTYAGPGDYYIVVITMPSTSWKVVIKPA